MNYLNKESLTSAKANKVWIALLTLGYIGFCGFLATIAINDYWMVRAFDADESGVLEDVTIMFRKQTFEPPNYIYGTLHTYVALSMLHLLGIFTKPNISEAAYILRFENTVAGGLVFILLFMLAKKLGSTKNWIYSGFILASSGTYLTYGYNAKPELLQLFFIVLSLYLCVDAIGSGKKKYLFAAGVTAGLSFTTKFFGILLIPMLMLAVLLSSQKIRGLKGIKEITVGTSLTLLGFILAVTLTSPYMVRDINVVIERLMFQTAVNKEGFLFSAEDPGYRWLFIIFSPMLLGFAGLFVLVLYIIDLARLAPCGIRSLDKQTLFLGVWIIFYGGYLLLNVNVREERYLLPILPFLAFFAGLKVGEIIDSKEISRSLKVSLIAVLISLLIPNIYQSFNFVKHQLNREHSQRILAGKWLRENVSPNSLIASDLYTYVPSTFSNHLHANYLDIWLVAKYRPDYIISSEEISRRFVDEGRANKFIEGKHNYMKHYTLYKGLRDGSGEYKLLKDFGEVRIYVLSPRTS